MKTNRRAYVYTEIKRNNFGDFAGKFFMAECSENGTVDHTAEFLVTGEGDHWQQRDAAMAHANAWIA